MNAPKGWYDDGSGRMRWWDGDAWTDQYAEANTPPARSGMRAKVSAMWSGIKERKWGVPAVLTAGVLILAGAGTGIGVSVGNSVSAQRAEQAAAARLSLIPDALEASGLDRGRAEDGGRSVFLDGQGRGFFSGDVSSTKIFSVLDALDAPASMTRRVGNTRALDGTQSYSWGEFTASWTYHPDDGLDMIIELAKD